MDGTLVRADPTELTIPGDAPPQARTVLLDPVEIESHDQRCQCTNSLTDNLGTPADRERQTMPLQPRLVRLQNDISCRIIRIGIHGVRAVELLRRWEAYVFDDEVGDLH